MKAKHYLKTNPIQNWKIADDVEHLYIGTVERSERWEKILAKNQPVVTTPIIDIYDE